jgi:hypothetical protein
MRVLRIRMVHSMNVCGRASVTFRDLLDPPRGLTRLANSIAGLFVTRTWKRLGGQMTTTSHQANGSHGSRDIPLIDQPVAGFSLRVVTTDLPVFSSRDSKGFRWYAPEGTRIPAACDARTPASRAGRRSVIGRAAVVWGFDDNAMGTWRRCPLPLPRGRPPHPTPPPGRAPGLQARRNVPPTCRSSRAAQRTLLDDGRRLSSDCSRANCWDDAVGRAATCRSLPPGEPRRR